MRHIEPKIQGANIVLVGSFNPAIFHPVWLEKNGLVRPEEAEEAQRPDKSIAVISEFAVFRIGAFSLRVEQERFQAITADPAYFGPLMDLVDGIFTILEHTPIRHMGINTNAHFALEGDGQWNALAQAVAPSEPWAKALHEPVFNGMTVRSTRPDASSEYVQIEVQRSAKLPFGLYVGTNEHFDFGDNGNATTACKALGESWDSALSYARRASESLLDLVSAE